MNRSKLLTRKLADYIIKNRHFCSEERDPECGGHSIYRCGRNLVLDYGSYSSDKIWLDGADITYLINVVTIRDAFDLALYDDELVKNLLDYIS